MRPDQHKTLQKWLLIFTGVVMMAFIFTFPTRDRRGMIDRIRLKVGADQLVSKQTMREIAAENAANGRRPATAKLDRKARARGKNSPTEQHTRITRSVAFYCNQEFNRQACGQWLNYCGESCRVMVQPDLWASLARNRR